MSIMPKFEFLVVMPSGNIKGFDDKGTAKAYINNYYYFKTRDNDVVGAYEDLTEDFDDIANVISYKIGVEEGQCRLFSTVDIIEKIQEESLFQDEKDELISKLLYSPNEINTFDYAIDNIFTNADSIDIMEPYGDPLTGQ